MEVFRLQPFDRGGRPRRAGPAWHRRTGQDHSETRIVRHHPRASPARAPRSSEGSAGAAPRTETDRDATAEAGGEQYSKDRASQDRAAQGRGEDRAAETEG